jgi:hypothetical protein
MQRFVLGLLVSCSIVISLVSCGGGGGGGDSAPPPIPAVTAINGGLAGSGTAGSLFVLDGTGFGTIAAATAGYTVDFKDAVSGAVVAAATINYAAGDWNDAFIKGTVPNGLATATTYKVSVTTAGGTSNAVDFMVVASVAFSPSTITWSAATSTLPVAAQGFPAVISTLVSTTTTTSYIYVLGGNIASSATATNGRAANTDAVYMSRLDNATGGLASAWTATTSLPDKRGFSAAVYANKFNSFAGGNGRIYVLGGLDSQGTATTTVYHAAVNDDGGLGAWVETTAMPQALFAHGAVIVRGRIYVAGGNGADNSPVKTVYSAQVESDGTLGAWAALPDLPDARAYHQVVTVAGYLYVIGGDNTAVAPLTDAQSASSQGSIYYAQISLSDGSLVNNTWTTNSGELGKNREKFTATVAGSYILVSGGLYNGLPGSSEQSYATINSDGSIGSFGGATGSGTIGDLPGGYDFYNHANAYFVDASGKPHVIILGGGDAVTGASHDGVWVCSQQ